jgi:hypothetical protein
MTKAIESGMAKLRIEESATKKQARIDSGQEVSPVARWLDLPIAQSTSRLLVGCVAVALIGLVDLVVAYVGDCGREQVPAGQGGAGGCAEHRQHRRAQEAGPSPDPYTFVYVRTPDTRRDITLRHHNSPITSYISGWAPSSSLTTTPSFSGRPA